MKPIRISLIACALVAGLAASLGARAADGPPPEAFRTVNPDNLVLIDTKYGAVAVELAPGFAPKHVARLRALIRAHFYDGQSFYRVIDGFVAQGGVGEDTASTKVRDEALEKTWPRLKAEFDRPISPDVTFTPLGNPDSFAPEVGHVDGFPAGRDAKDGRMWILHCPGTFAFARDNEDDSATTEFYIVIGQAPRRLDRNLTAFGRVLEGMQVLQKLERGDPEVDSGVIQDKAKQDAILRMRLASDLPEKERPAFQVIKTESPAFAAVKDSRRHPAPEFYHRPPLANLDVCSVPVAVKKETPPSP
ncbi:MAG TPA: peptidylprolyl isomerase [Rhizomicrobium sp.]|jgi:peptidylprolyl isomerase